LGRKNRAPKLGRKNRASKIGRQKWGAKNRAQNGAPKMGHKIEQSSRGFTGAAPQYNFE